MKLYAAAFSEKGRELAKRIEGIPLSIDYGKLPDICGGRRVQSRTRLCLRGAEPLGAWTAQAFAEGTPILFLGAAGIAVRAIAGNLAGKAADSPVLVIDEAGQFVIPILAGHLGGANELAVQLAAGLSAQAVLTTATDVNQVWSVDVFARQNGLRVQNTEGIAPVSAKLLAGERVTMAVEGVEKPEDLCFDLPLEDALRFVPWPDLCGGDRQRDRSDRVCDIVIASGGNIPPKAVLGLVPKRDILGIGCKKGKSYSEIQRAVDRAETDGLLKKEDLAGVASIDQKEEEPGIHEFAERNRLPYYVFTKEELRAVPGTFHGSAFVEQTVGVDNVCERAAVAGSGGGTLIVPKQAQDGITIAVARMHAGGKRK